MAASTSHTYLVLGFQIPFPIKKPGLLEKSVSYQFNGKVQSAWNSLAVPESKGSKTDKDMFKDRKQLRVSAKFEYPKENDDNGL